MSISAKHEISKLNRKLIKPKSFFTSFLFKEKNFVTSMPCSYSKYVQYSLNRFAVQRDRHSLQRNNQTLLIVKMHSACQNHTVHINTLVYFIFNRLCPTIIRNKVLNQNLRIKEVFKIMSIGISIKAVSSKKRKGRKKTTTLFLLQIFSVICILVSLQIRADQRFMLEQELTLSIYIMSPDIEHRLFQ